MERKVKYHYEFKLECVELVVRKHYSCQAVSIEKGISESNIRKGLVFTENMVKLDYWREKIRPTHLISS